MICRLVPTSSISQRLVVLQRRFGEVLPSRHICTIIDRCAGGVLPLGRRDYARVGHFEL
jgi:hypothetical protein